MHKKSPQIKSVVLTGYDNFDYAQRSIKARIFDYLLKPVTEEDLLKTCMNLKMKIEQGMHREDDV